jgi:dolichol-phosphate mannosyltransferase
MPSRDYELALVMPVYNEEGCIAAVVRSWRDMLRASGVNFVMIVINDGSRDRTASILQGLADDECIRVIHQANMGHGPTILRGYRQAVTLADWVFQCDSDNEMGPDAFGGLWEVRHPVDAVFGSRQNRSQNVQRSLISFCSRMTVDLLFGRGIEDVNSPYRLIRSSVLGPILECIPPDTFAPNVVLCGALTFAGARVRSVPVPCRPRQTGRGSIVRWKLWKVALRSFGQTVRCSRRIRRSRLRQQCATDVADAPARVP